MGKKWKTIVIILIVVLIVENLLFFWVLSVGLDVVKKEDQCREVVCQDYEAFLYDPLNEICDCYIDNEIAYSEVIR